MAATDEAIVTPDADPILDHAAEPIAPPPARRSRFFPAVVGGAVAAALGFGAAQFVPDGWPLQSTADLETRIAAQTAALSEAEAEIARLGAALVAVEARPAADPALADRVAALEAFPSPDDSRLEARMVALEQEFAAIAAMPADGSAASPAAIAAQSAAIAALQAEVAALKGSTGSAADITAAAEAAEAKLAEAEARAADLRAAAEADAAQSLARTSVRQIAVALETGGPFETALTAFDPAQVPDILAANALTGLPTVTDLQSNFPDAARAALDEALRADMGEGWSERVGSFLRSQTGARSTTPREGDDPDAVLSRAEAALAAGLVPDALALVADLPTVSQEAMANWVSSATLYLAGQEALDTLTAATGGLE